MAFKARHQSDQSFFPTTLEIHWLSIINSAVLVLLLVGFVLLILTRMLNKDFAQYAKGDELDAEEGRLYVSGAVCVCHCVMLVCLWCSVCV